MAQMADINVQDRMSVLRDLLATRLQNTTPKLAEVTLMLTAQNLRELGPELFMTAMCHLCEQVDAQALPQTVKVTMLNAGLSQHATQLTEWLGNANKTVPLNTHELMLMMRVANHEFPMRNLALRLLAAHIACCAPDLTVGDIRAQAYAELVNLALTSSLPQSRIPLMYQIAVDVLERSRAPHAVINEAPLFIRACDYLEPSNAMLLLVMMIRQLSALDSPGKPSVIGLVFAQAARLPEPLHHKVIQAYADRFPMTDVEPLDEQQMLADA